MLQLVPNLIFVIMAQVIVNLKRIQVFENENSCNCNLVFNENIKGYQRNADANGEVEYVEGDVNYISIGRSALTAQLCDLNDDIALYRCCLTHAFGQKELAIILHGAILTLERTLHSAGEVYGKADDGTDLAYSRDCYTTEVVGIKLGARAQALLDGAITL